jgi:predicted DNA-binding protein (MmcQ/YjbR family)
MKININIFDLDKFTIINNKYIYREQIDNNFICEIILDNDYLYEKVYDVNTLEEYIPFNVTTHIGSICSYLHEEVDKIVSKLTKQVNIVNDLIKYIKDKYNIEPVYPFKDDSVSFTLNKNNKWFLLYMNIPYKSINVNKNTNVNIINIKMNIDDINRLVDNKIFFNAYHMNKKYWITINLDNIASINDICEYIDSSYNLVK